MTILLAEFAVLAAVIIVAGTFLARFADELAERLRLGRSLAGVFLLALVTSLPELMVDCRAAMIPAPDLAMGDLLGSCLMNLLILAGLDMSYRSKQRILSPAAAAHALSASAAIHLTALALLFMLIDVPFSFAGLGIGSIVILVGYLLCLRLIALDQRIAMSLAEGFVGQAALPTKDNGTRSVLPPQEAQEKVRATPMRRLVTGFAIAAAAILLVGPLLAVVADELAVQSGLGKTFVGTVLVALATSLPELSSTRACMRMGAHDMAIGNILGSNAFNIAIIPAVDLFFDGPLLSSVSNTHAVTAAAVIAITAIASMGMLYRVERRVLLVEPDAALVVVMTVAALYLVYRMG